MLKNIQFNFIFEGNYLRSSIAIKFSSGLSLQPQNR